MFESSCSLDPIDMQFLGQTCYTQHSETQRHRCALVTREESKIPQTRLPLSMHFEIKFHWKWIIALALCQGRCVLHLKYWIQSNGKISFLLKIHNLALLSAEALVCRQKLIGAGSHVLAWLIIVPVLYIPSYHNITTWRTNGRIKNKKEMISLKHLLWNYKGRTALFKLSFFFLTEYELQCPE